MFKDGKLFGKLNVIDLLVIIVAIAVVAAVGMKVTGHTGRTEQTNAGVDVVYTVKVPWVDAAVGDSIQEFITAAQTQGKPGDQLMAGTDLVDAYVTKVEVTPTDSGIRMGFNEAGQLLVTDSDKVDLLFTIVGKAENATTTKVGSQEVRVGRPHVVKTTHFELQSGITQTCQWKEAA